MTANDVIEELMKYEFTFEEACKIYKCIVKKKSNVLDMFEKDLADRIGVKDAQIVMNRLKAVPVDYTSVNPLHRLVYNMGKEMDINKVIKMEVL